MKIGFLVSQPTQFEGPFFQYAARKPEHEIHVIYTDQIDRRLKLRSRTGN